MPTSGGLLGALGAPRWRSWGAFWLFFGAAWSSFVLLGAPAPRGSEKEPPRGGFGSASGPQNDDFCQFTLALILRFVRCVFRLISVTLWVLFFSRGARKTRRSRSRRKNQRIFMTFQTSRWHRRRHKAAPQDENTMLRDARQNIKLVRNLWIF